MEETNFEEHTGPTNAQIDIEQQSCHSPPSWDKHDGETDLFPLGTLLNATNPLGIQSSHSASGVLNQGNETELTPVTDIPVTEQEGTVDEEVTVKPKKVRQRVWTVVLSAIVACIPFLLVGCTLGFPSGALLDLTDLEDRPDYKLSRELADLFGVRMWASCIQVLAAHSWPCLFVHRPSQTNPTTDMLLPVTNRMQIIWTPVT